MDDRGVVSGGRNRGDLTPLSRDNEAADEYTRLSASRRSGYLANARLLFPRATHGGGET